MSSIAEKATPPPATKRGHIPTVGFVSLGCPKALVDSERILTKLRAEGYAIAPDYAGADVVVVNTCGFLDSAKQESLDAIGEAMAENGRVIVADTGNHRVQIFDKDGKFIKEHPVSGWEEFYTEPNLALLGSDLLATDSYNHRCARYTDGTLVSSWGKSGSGRGDFNRPIGIATDKQGNVYVSDTLNQRVQKFYLTK